jgi:hypothetical protein
LQVFAPFLRQELLKWEDVIGEIQLNGPLGVDVDVLEVGRGTGFLTPERRVAQRAFGHALQSQNGLGNIRIEEAGIVEIALVT